MKPLLARLALLLAVHAAAAVVFLGGCAKRTPAALPALPAAAVSAELAPTNVTVDDDTLSPLAHDWLEAALARHLAATWHDRPYQPELKDCDDFTDFLVANVRHWFGEKAATGSGGALIGRYTVFIAEANKGAGAWHRVALVRTERGWFVADPQKLIPSPWRIQLVPLATYGRTALLAAF